MLAIYRYHIARGVDPNHAHESEPMQPDDLKRRRRNMRKHGLPHLVAELGGAARRISMNRSRARGYRPAPPRELPRHKQVDPSQSLRDALRRLGCGRNLSASGQQLLPRAHIVSLMEPSVLSRNMQVSQAPLQR